MIEKAHLLIRKFHRVSSVSLFVMAVFALSEIPAVAQPVPFEVSSQVHFADQVPPEMKIPAGELLLRIPTPLAPAILPGSTITITYGAPIARFTGFPNPESVTCVEFGAPLPSCPFQTSVSRSRLVLTFDGTPFPPELQIIVAGVELELTGTPPGKVITATLSATYPDPFQSFVHPITFRPAIVPVAVQNGP